jgi:hypothetical protein
MKKSFSLFILIFLGLVVLRAQSSLKLCAVVETTNGERLEYMLSDLPRIIYDDSMVTLTTNTTIVEFPQKEILKIYLTESITSINDCKSPDGSFSLCHDQVFLTDFAVNEVVTLFCADGHQLWRETIHDNGRLTISLNQLPKGLYIIKTNHQSIKITKK